MFASPSGSLCSPLKPQKGRDISHPPPVKAIGYIGGSICVAAQGMLEEFWREERFSAMRGRGAKQKYTLPRASAILIWLL